MWCTGAPPPTAADCWNVYTFGSMHAHRYSFLAYDVLWFGVKLVRVCATALWRWCTALRDERFLVRLWRGRRPGCHWRALFFLFGVYQVGRRLLNVDGAPPIVALGVIAEAEALPDLRPAPVDALRAAPVAMAVADFVVDAAAALPAPLHADQEQRLEAPPWAADPACDGASAVVGGVELAMWRYLGGRPA